MLNNVKIHKIYLMHDEMFPVEPLLESNDESDLLHSHLLP